MPKTYFVTGISTDVGKTIASAILVEALQADYWKPIQSGALENTDTHRVEQLITNSKTTCHPSCYELKTPISPHAAAAIDGVSIDLNNISRPKTSRPLVIEGTGGLLVPLNDTATIVDLIKPKDQVIVVSRHYLGSINHTLLTVNFLKDKGFQVAIIFSGDEHKSTEEIIIKKTNAPIIGRIDEAPYFDRHVIKACAKQFLEKDIHSAAL